MRTRLRSFAALVLSSAVMSAAPVVARDGPKSAAHRDGPDLDSVPECAGAAYRLYGLDFSPYQDGQDPNVNPDVTPSQIRERLQRVAPCATWVRTFSVTHGLEASGAIAHSLGLQIAAGAWLGKNPQQNQQEIANLIALGQTGQADMLVVGSEALLRNDVTDAQLIAYINQVKQAVPGLPVATADVHDVLLLHPGVISASDVVLVNYYPYWVGVSVDQAMANVNSWHDLITAAAGGKPVIVSETGWPSQGDTIGSAVASLTNASYYFLNFVSWARAKSVNYFYFEAFDESWKAQYEGPQGAHWGILDKDGSLKAGFARVFNGETLPNNWDCSGVVGGAGTPSIGLTFVPPYGSSLNLAGQIAHVSPDAFQVAVYLSVNGGVTWYVKPTLVQPITYAQCDGTWSTTVVTGGSDQLATDYAAFLVPRTYPPPALIGQPLPNDLFQNAAASALVSRSTGSISGTVSDAAGNPISGVAMGLAGAEVQNVISVTGRYSFYRLNTAGPFTITPLAAGYTFTPPSRTFATAAGAQTASFVGTANAELSASMTATPAGGVTLGSTLTYLIRLTNGGPGPATVVSLTDTLPPGVSLVSVSTDTGSCGGTLTVTCNVGVLARSATATVTLIVRTTAAGTIVNTATAAAAELDTNPGDNAATIVTAVTAPPPPLLVMSLAANVAFPVAAGTPITWTALAAGGAGPYTFRFWIYDGSAWSVKQEWSSANTFTWTPALPGSYLIQVWARNAASSSAYDAWRGTGAAVSTPGVLTITTVTASPLSAAAGSPVTWTATAAGGTAPYSCKFFVWDGAAWTVGQEWSACAAWTWTPPAAGTYDFQVWARNAGSPAALDAWRAFGPYTATRPASLTVTTLTADQESPAPAGTPVQWTARNAGGLGPYTYKFYVHNGSSWSVGQNWSAANTWTWSAPDAGTYTFQVWARNAGSVSAFDAWLGAGPHTATAAAPLGVTGLASDRLFPTAAGTPVQWTARAMGGVGPYAYKFYVYNGSSWTVGQDWSAARTWTWIPPAAGTYWLQVWARNAGSATPYDAWLGAGPVSVSGSAPLSVSSLTASPGAPLVAGGPAVLTATAGGGIGPYMYKFYVFNGTSWTLAQDWSPSNAHTWTPPAAGSYAVQVWVRSAGSMSPFDAWGSLGPLAVVP